MEYAVLVLGLLDYQIDDLPRQSKRLLWKELGSWNLNVVAAA